MAFQQPKQQPSFKRLKSVLRTSGIQQTNNALFQVIDQLLDQLAQFQGVINGEISSTNTNIVNLDDVSWDVLTDGDLISPEIIFANGEVIMVRTPSL